MPGKQKIWKDGACNGSTSHIPSGEVSTICLVRLEPNQRKHCNAQQTGESEDRRAYTTRETVAEVNQGRGRLEEEKRWKIKMQKPYARASTR